MVDRLSEIYAMSGVSPPNKKTVVTNKTDPKTTIDRTTSDIVIDVKDINDKDQLMKQKTANIQNNINAIKDLTTRIEKSVRYDERNKLIKELKTKIPDLQNAAHEAAHVIQQCHRSANTSAEQNWVALQKEKFQSIVTDYQNIIQESQKKIDDIARRQLKMYVDDEKIIENIIENSNPFEVMHEMSKTENIRDVIDSIKERHDRIVFLEKSVLALLELFKDLAVMVDTQQEKLDTIGKHIDKTKINVQKAEKELIRGNKYLKSNRSKMCCILMIFMGIIAFLFIYNAFSKFVDL